MNSIKINEAVYRTEDGTPGTVLGVHPDKEMFRVHWSDDTLSMEAVAEEHESWERIV